MKYLYVIILMNVINDWQVKGINDEKKEKIFFSFREIFRKIFGK